MSSGTVEVVLNLTAQTFNADSMLLPGTVIPVPSKTLRGWAFHADTPNFFIGALSGTVPIEADGEPNPNFGLNPEVVLGAVHKAATEYLRARGIDRVPDVARWSGARGPHGGCSDSIDDELDPQRELRDTRLPSIEP